MGAVKFVIAIHGTRGDVEPCAAVGLELLRRGHEVFMAVPPNLVDFVRSAGLPAVVAYGPDSQKQLQGDVFERPDALTAASPSDWLRIGSPLNALRKARAAATDGWSEMSETLKSLAEGADLIVSGTAYQEIAANIAEFRRIRMAEVHYFPVRANTQVLPTRLPALLAGPTFALGEWFYWRLIKPAEDEQRQALGLRRARHRPVRRIVESAALEIQAYDPVFFPGLSAEWGGRRPIIGSLTLQLPTTVDDEVDSWIAEGTPPIYFGFGSMPVDSPAEMMAMVSQVCTGLGERALICSGASEFPSQPEVDHVKVVASVNHAAVFPRCRAVVHHGGAGTTSAGARAGVPALVLWVAAEQPLWGKQVTRLGIGRARRFSTVTCDSLNEDLRAVLQPETIRRAREMAHRMIPAVNSIGTAAELLEKAADVQRLR